jgi:hypothetical protein
MSVAALSFAQVSVADAQSVYVAPGGVYVAPGASVYVTPNPGPYYGAPPPVAAPSVYVPPPVSGAPVVAYDDEQPPVYVAPGGVYGYGAAPPAVYAAPPAAYGPPLYSQGGYQAGYYGGYQGGYVMRQRVVAPIDAYASTVVPRPPAPVPYARRRY